MSTSVWYDYSLQKFKLNLANTVISQENSSLLSMNTSELLDLFQLSDTPGEVAKGGEKVRLCSIPTSDIVPLLHL